MGAEASPETDPPEEENGGGSGNGNLSDGPWGPGGYAVVLPLDAEPDVRDYLRSRVPELSPGNCELKANYMVAGLSKTGPEGPEKPSDVNLANGDDGNSKRVYDLLTRNVWEWEVVREKAVRATLAQSNLPQPLGIVLSWTFSEHEDADAMIFTAHAFTHTWRVLVGAQRAVLVGDDLPGLPEAIQALVAEVAALQARLSTPVPVLVEAPAVGLQTVLELAKSNLDYLVELTPGWSEGGIVPADTGDPERFSGAGASIGALFPDGWQLGVTLSVPIRLTARSLDIPATALMAGPPGARRIYLAGARDRSKEGHHHARSRRMLEGWATKWCQHQLAGATDNYGFEKFRTKKDKHFHKHFTLVAARDAYLVSGGRS
jgi:hypothetical protein